MTPMDLDLWILYATEGLSWDSKKRVSAEIMAHFDEASQAERAAGRSDDEAQAEALRTLGDPHEANRRFRKAYLCEGDLEKINYYHKYYRLPENWFKEIVGLVTIALVTIALIAISFILVFNKSHNPFPFIVYIVIFYFVYMRNKLMAHFLFTPNREKIEHRFGKAMLTAYSLPGISIVLLLLGILLYGIMHNISIAHIVTIALVIVLVIVLCGLLIARECSNYIPLLRKMREQEGQDEQPEWERYA